MDILNILDQQIITILDVQYISVGTNIEKDSLEALFTCRVCWCPEDTDAHIAALEKELTKTSYVKILGYSPTYITPGKYRKTYIGPEKAAFQQIN